MPATSTASQALTSGAQSSLTFAHTSNTDPLYVLLSWYVGGGAVEVTDVVTGVTYGGVALTQGGTAPVHGQTMQWWRLAAPVAGTANVVVTLSSGRRVSAAAVNLSGWPSAIADHVFAADGRFRTSGQPTITIDSDTTAEVIDWIGWNDPSEVTAPGAGQTELWSQDGLGGGSGAGGDQKSAGSLKAGSSPTATMSWSMAGSFAEYWGIAALSFLPAPAPPAPFSDGDPGELATIELTDRSDVVRPYAAVDLNDRDVYYGGYKAPQVLQFSPIVRALSDRQGQIEHVAFGAILSDTERVLRGLLEDATNRYLTNAPLIVRTVTDVDRRAEQPMHLEMAGAVTDFSPRPDLQFELSGSDWLKRKRARKTTAPEFWQPLLTRTDLPLLPDTLVNKAAPFWYGKVSDEAAGATLYPRGTFDPGWLDLDYALVALAGPAAGDYCVYVSTIKDGVESTVMATGLGFDLSGSQQVDVSFRTSTTPTFYRVYFSDGREDFNPFTNPTGGSFARYRDYSPSEIPETGNKTLAEVVSDLNASGATSSIVADYAAIIGSGDADRLQDYYDTNGQVPSSFSGLADIIGGSDLNALMAGRRTVRIDSVTWGADYVAVSGSIIGRGAVPTLYVGEETYGGVTRSAFLVSRFANKSIVGAYVGGVRQSSTGSSTELEVPFLDDYATTFGANYRDINGRRYTIVYATGQTALNAINGSKPITVNLWGIEATGDTTGSLLVSPLRFHQHFARNFLAADTVPDTTWLTVAPDLPGVSGAPMQDDDSYDTAEDAIEDRLVGGHEGGGGVGVNGAYENALDVLASLQQNGDFDAGFSRLGQLMVSVEPVAAPADADVVALTDILHIDDRSFSARTTFTQFFWNVIPFQHTQDYTGLTDSGWFLRGQSEDADSVANYDQERTAPEFGLRWLRASTSQGASTILDVVLRMRTRFRHPLRTVTLSAPYLATASIELGTVLRLDHGEGLGASGWVGHDMRVTRIETDLNDPMTRRIEGYDLGPIYDGLDDSEEPTETAQGLRDQTSIIQLQENVTNLQVDLSTVQAEIVTLDGRVSDIETAVRTRGRVRAATTANITIATALNAGDTLDGVTLATGDLVLVKDQSAPEENGIYEVGASPARTDQFSAYDDHPGALVTVQEGSTNADTIWLCTSNVGGTLNTTAIAFSSVSGGSGAPTGASYVTLATDGTLTSERVLTAGGGITVTDAGAGSTVTIAITTRTRAITFVIDGGGSAITTGVKADVYVPYACTITAVTMLADQSGSVVVDIWKDSYANYPPTVADTITASAKPTISAATKSQDTTLTGWTTSVSAGDTLRFNIDSASTITRLVLTLTVTV